MRADLLDILRRGPVPLAADNFTPLSRTPWAGADLGRRYKSHVPGAAGARIGESWEFSCDPAFPSRVMATGASLQELIDAHRVEALSAQQRHCDVLVKLLNAQEPLSLQVHPRDDDSYLTADECGKPESWLVLAAEPGAGIYLGFSRAHSKGELRAALQQGDAAKELLHFETVQPGDYFELEPGVPHAIGPGVTLLEPQRVRAGKTGKTFRMWDWGRVVDGRPRELHVAQSLRLVDPRTQVGPAFVASLKKPAHCLVDRVDLKVMAYAPNDYYQTFWVRAVAPASFQWSIRDGYGALVMLAGELETHGIVLKGGEPAFLPAAAMPLRSHAAAATEFAVIIPSGASLAFDI